MDEIDAVRELGADVPVASAVARDEARQRLLVLARAADRSRSRYDGARLPRLRRVLAAVVTLFVFVFGVAVWPVPFAAPSLGPEAAAAAALNAAADVAAAQPRGSQGRYRYTKSRGVFMATTTLGGGRHFSYLSPVAREIWIAPDGSGRIRETRGEPVFLSEEDRAQWQAAGSPRDEGTNGDFGRGALAYENLDALPTNPALLRLVILARALETQVRVDAEMFVIVGDLLRETVARPELTSALYRVAASLDRIELLGETKDRAGRSGIAVAMTSDYAGAKTRRVLVFDPRSGRLLAEEEVLLEPYRTYRGPHPPVVIGHSTYLESKIVDRLP
ncbi:MAG: CU044_5270 family protein [Chloroflexota bacterium]|nr:CU044_5270 family protein [Chloroflexota bacterium]